MEREGRADVVIEMLRLARKEGALDGEAFEAFVDALRERADIVLGEQRGLGAELETAKAAHESLLAHHRDVLARVSAELMAIATLPWPRLVRQARRRLTALADTAAAGAAVISAVVPTRARQARLQRYLPERPRVARPPAATRGK